MPHFAEEGQKELNYWLLQKKVFMLHFAEEGQKDI